MDIVTLAAARKGGGSGGDVTKQYVDEHLALKADKSETQQYPIADSTTGINPTITDSADGLIQNVKVYGRSRKSVNLFDKDATDINNGYISGSYISSDGVVTEYSSYDVSEYIPVHPSTTYTLSSIEGNAPGICSYDENKNYISGIWYNNNTVVQYTTPNNAAYIRFSIRTTKINDIQLELGSTPTPYEPYGEIISIGDSGTLTITTANSDNTASTSATVTTGIPLYAVGDVKDELDEKKGVVVKRCEKKSLDDLEWILTSNSRWRTPLINAKPVNTNDEIINAISSNYTADSANTLYPNLQLIAMALNIQNELLIRNGSDTDTPTGDIIYELAEPYELPLTSAELTQLRNLRTFDSTTNVTVTDNPTVDIGYLLNTDNGQAVADVQTDLQGQISNIPAWLTDIPENHKNIYRGKYLGNSVSAAQLAAIADGSFDDLYVGDYWTIPVTIDNVEQSVKWRIADIDYFIGYRDTVDTTKRMTAHHLVIVPDTSLYLSQPGSRTNGYNGSSIRTSGLDKAKTAINAVFPDMVLSHKNYISTAIDATGTVTRCEEQTCTIELMSQVMVFGFNRFQNLASLQEDINYSLGGQFALFRLSPKWKSNNAEEPIIPTSGATYLIQDPCYSANRQYWTAIWPTAYGAFNYTYNGGVRPYFIIGTR